MFDPYHKWLGILPKDQPPNHYRLLSVELFESDPDVIEGAADRVMGFIRQYQSGEHAAIAAKILNEIAAARLCLLKPKSKAEYDAQLRKQLAQTAGLAMAKEDGIDFEFATDTAPKNQTKSPRKQAAPKTGSPKGLLIGGGIAAAVCVALLIVFLNSGGTPQQKPVDQSQDLAAKSPTSTKPIEPVSEPAKTQPVVETRPDAQKTASAQKVSVEVAGPAVDLLEAVDLQRDRFEGDLKKDGAALICGPTGRFYLPVTVPDDYQLRFNLKRTAGADGFGIGFGVAGHAAAITFDGYGLKLSGAYVDGRAPDSNCTTRPGTLFQENRLSSVFITVHPDHLHAEVDGKTIVDWRGESTRLFYLPGHHPFYRETPFFASAPGATYRIESATLVPLKPEPQPETVAALDRQVDLMPLIDIVRDTKQGRWILSEGVLSSSEGMSKIEIPLDVPEEYTISATVEASREHTEAVIGLVNGPKFFQVLAAPGYAGLDMIDGRRYDQTDTARRGAILKPGFPIRIDCTVTKNRVHAELDGKPLIDWSGDRERLQIPFDWATANGRRLFLGSNNSIKFREIKLGPPIEPPKISELPPLSPGMSADLLSLIDPTRDALAGTWVKDGANLRAMGDIDYSTLYVPCNVPDEYKLTVRVARETGAKFTNEQFVLKLPIRSQTAEVVLDGYGSQACGINIDNRIIDGKNATRRDVMAIPQTGVHELIYVVRRNSIKVVRGTQTLVDWRGNIERLVRERIWGSPGGRIAISSLGTRFRIEKLAIEALEKTPEPIQPTLGSDGDLLAFIDPERDARLGEWKRQGDALVSPDIEAARLRIPVDVPDKYELTGTVERKSGINELFLGLVVAGHPCAVSVDGFNSEAAGLTYLDAKTFHIPANITFRKYAGALFPIGQRVKFRCTVLPDSVIAVFGDKEVLRWHGDPRRFVFIDEYSPPNCISEDRNRPWLGSWNSEFVFHELKLRSLDEEEADAAKNSFAGIYPIKSIENEPLRIVSTSEGRSSVPDGAQSASSSLPAIPSRAALDAARANITKTYATEYQESKEPAVIPVIADRMQERATKAADPAEKYAYLMEARDLLVQRGDLLGAFRVIDSMAKSFDILRYAEQIDLLQKTAKKAKNSIQHRYIAIVAWKIAADAAAAEEYTTAKEACQKAITAARSSSDSELVSRAGSQLRLYEGLFNYWKAARDGLQTLKQSPDDAAAHVAVGQYQCWVRKDWDHGTAWLAHSPDAVLSKLATADLANPTDGPTRRLVADEWLKYAKSQKNAVIQTAASERAATWYELATGDLEDADRTNVERDLEIAYELASGRTFKKILTSNRNLIEAPAVADCQLKIYELKIDRRFEFGKSWLLSFEFNPRNLDGGWHQVFFCGDGAIGQDPLFVRLEGNRLTAMTGNISEGQYLGIEFVVPPTAIGQWNDFKLLYDSVTGNLELYFNHRLIRRDVMISKPGVDREMPMFLGAVDGGGWQRYTGQVRKVWLGNIP